MRCLSRLDLSRQDASPKTVTSLQKANCGAERRPWRTWWASIMSAAAAMDGARNSTVTSSMLAWVASISSLAKTHDLLLVRTNREKRNRITGLILWKVAGRSPGREEGGTAELFVERERRHGLRGSRGGGCENKGSHRIARTGRASYCGPVLRMRLTAVDQPQLVINSCQLLLTVSRPTLLNAKPHWTNSTPGAESTRSNRLPVR